MHRHPVAIRLIVIACLLTSHRNLACECGRSAEPADAFAEAGSIYVGTVVTIHDRLWFGRRVWTSVFGYHYSGWSDYVEKYGFEVTLRVETTFKGAHAKQVRVLTSRGGGDCGFQFELGRKYLVYTHADSLRTDICTPTQSAEQAGKYLEWLTARSVH